jgi:hypothetical protein
VAGDEGLADHIEETPILPGMRMPWTRAPPQKLDTPEVMLNTDEIQPVDPAPVETRTPLEDCVSFFLPAAMR